MDLSAVAIGKDRNIFGLSSLGVSILPIAIWYIFSSHPPPHQYISNTLLCHILSRNIFRLYFHSVPEGRLKKKNKKKKQTAHITKQESSDNSNRPYHNGLSGIRNSLGGCRCGLLAGKLVAPANSSSSVSHVVRNHQPDGRGIFLGPVS